MEMRFGIAMRAFAISERFHTRSRVWVAPTKTTREKTTR